MLRNIKESLVNIADNKRLILSAEAKCPVMAGVSERSQLCCLSADWWRCDFLQQPQHFYYTLGHVFYQMNFSWWLRVG